MYVGVLGLVCSRQNWLWAEYGCMVTIELRRYAKFQVYIFKTDSGKKARRGGGLWPILPIPLGVN